MVIKMTSKRALCVIVGIILVVAGIIAIVYAQNEISSSWGYTWTQSYSNYEARIMTIKNVGTGSLVLGILDIVVIGLYKALKK